MAENPYLLDAAFAMCAIGIPRASAESVADELDALGLLAWPDEPQRDEAAIRADERQRCAERLRAEAGRRRARASGIEQHSRVADYFDRAADLLMEASDGECQRGGERNPAV